MYVAVDVSACVTYLTRRARKLQGFGNDVIHPHSTTQRHKLFCTATMLQPSPPTAVAAGCRQGERRCYIQTRKTHPRQQVRRLVEAQLEGHPEVNPCRNRVSRLDDHPQAPQSRPAFTSSNTTTAHPPHPYTSSCSSSGGRTKGQRPPQQGPRPKTQTNLQPVATGSCHATLVKNMSACSCCCHVLFAFKTKHTAFRGLYYWPSSTACPSELSGGHRVSPKCTTLQQSQPFSAHTARSYQWGAHRHIHRGSVNRSSRG